MDCVPLAALVPDQAPDAVQLVVFVDDQFSVALPPLVMALGPTLSVRTGAADVTVTVAVCAAVPPDPVQVSV